MRPRGLDALMRGLDARCLIHALPDTLGPHVISLHLAQCRSTASPTQPVILAQPIRVADGAQ